MASSGFSTSCPPLSPHGALPILGAGPGVTRCQPGDLVVMSFCSCMSCKSCMDMHPAYCSNIMALNAMGRRDDGSSAFKDATGAEVISHFFGQSSFSSAVVADEKSLVKVDAAYDISVLDRKSTRLNSSQ